MLEWLVHEVMTIAGTVTGWFIAPASANFGVLQLTISLVLIVICILIVIFWRDLVSFFRKQPRP